MVVDISLTSLSHSTLSHSTDKTCVCFARSFLEDMKEIKTPREAVASKLAKLARLDDILMRSPRPGGAVRSHTGISD